MIIFPQRVKIIPMLLLISAFSILSFGSAKAQSKFPASEWVKKDTRFKIDLVREFIAEANRHGVTIRFSPEYYVKELDSTIANSIRNNDERGLGSSIGIMIHTIAAMDGDWDNGENRLEHAKKLLGPDNFTWFKDMFPQKYARLLEERKEDPDPWKRLGYSRNLDIQYNAVSLSYVSKTIARVWAKTQYVDIQEGLKDLKVRGLGKKDPEKYDHDLYLYKIDCAKNTFAILSDYLYRKDGSLIEAHDFPDRWEAIPPSSVIDVISKTVCAEPTVTGRTNPNIRKESNE